MQYFQLSVEARRIASNLAQRHDAWVIALQREAALPSSMFFAAKTGGREYLTVKKHSRDSGSTMGVRSEETEALLLEYKRQRDEVQEAVTATQAALAEYIRLYRTLRLPLMPEPAAKILRELDIAGLLGHDLMLVGANAFAAYELEAGCRFMPDEATEDFDLAWCRGSGISLSAISEKPVGSPLLKVLHSIDASYRINKKKPFQALNKSGYDVELLVAPSQFRTLSDDEAFSPMAILDEQEWLLRGTPVRHVLVSTESKTCPIFAPDPRWMALHKLWLSKKPKRNELKRPKDRRQGNQLLNAVRDHMSITYPLDTDFVLDLPEELLPHFNQWAHDNDFIPAAPGEITMR